MFRCVSVSVLVAASLAAGVSSAVASEGNLRATLSGAFEFSGNTGNNGDLNGFGSALVNLVSTTKLCYAIIVQGIDTPSVAHIHEGAAGINGPIVVTLGAPGKGNGGTKSGCVNIDEDLALEIGRYPGNFYVNVHTGSFSAGALRGQLE